MQPPLPRKPAPTPSLGQETQRAPATRHLQPPPDLAPSQEVAAGPHLVASCDHALIRAWAEHQGAEPATGEATQSGPATVHVNDQGTGLRFNFPAAARFRTVSWDEWFEQFDREGLVFVFEARHHDGETTFGRFGGAFFRLVPRHEWGSRPLATLATSSDATAEGQ